MTEQELRDLFDKHEDEFLRFEKVEPADRLSSRPDLHAFILLDKLVPGTTDIVSCAAHDEFWVDITQEELAASGITEAQVLQLIRCGLRADRDCGFAFFA